MRLTTVIVPMQSSNKQQCKQLIIVMGRKNSSKWTFNEGWYPIILTYEYDLHALQIAVGLVSWLRWNVEHLSLRAGEQSIENHWWPMITIESSSPPPIPTCNLEILIPLPCIFLDEKWGCKVHFWHKHFATFINKWLHLNWWFISIDDQRKKRQSDTVNFFRTAIKIRREKVANYWAIKNH